MKISDIPRYGLPMQIISSCILIYPQSGIVMIDLFCIQNTMEPMKNINFNIIYNQNIGNQNDNAEYIVFFNGQSKNVSKTKKISRLVLIINLYANYPECLLMQPAGALNYKNAL